MGSDENDTGTHIAIEHPRFRRVQREIFTSPLVPDCMAHECHMQAEGERKLDACCQYGVDVDLGERDGILSHAEQLRSILNVDAKDRPWFHEEEHEDADFPSGRYVRTQTLDGGCIFLQHNGRGCAVHRASLEAGWDFHGIKPHVCRLFPVSYDDEGIVLSDDYADYSCAYQPSSPSVYRVQRADLGAIFGEELVAVLDRVEADVLAQEPARLRVI